MSRYSENPCSPLAENESSYLEKIIQETSIFNVYPYSRNKENHKPSDLEIQEKWLGTQHEGGWCKRNLEEETDVIKANEYEKPYV